MTFDGLGELLGRRQMDEPIVKIDRCAVEHSPLEHRELVSGQHLVSEFE